jgi:cytoskeletal protein RodZ
MEDNLGNKLRGAREAAGLTIDDAVYRAKMPRAVVEALEAGDFGFFSSPLYARSFLRQYGDYVELDVAPWIEDLIPTALIDGDAVEAFIEIENPTSMPVLRENTRQRQRSGSMAAVWLIVITAGLVWGGAELFMGFERKHSEVPAQVETTALAKQPPPEDTETSKKNTALIDGSEPAKRAIIVREE